ncbi:MAG TPA: hypothetical protein VE090_03335 [Methylomirabilota bacterium]|nr:hypothetical protein [Methylomirabilota bacterium]
MSAKHHVIYVPGLDDGRKGYELIIHRWSLFGIIPHVHRIGWKDGENNFSPKLQKLVEVVDNLIKQGKIVSLVGGSAGGSAVLNTFLERSQINAVVNVCGRLRAGENISPPLEQAARKSPAFRESVDLFEKKEQNMTSAQRSQVLTLTPLWDEIVPKSTVFLKGANNKTLPSVEHMISGLMSMTVFSPIIMQFIKEKAREI